MRQQNLATIVAVLLAASGIAAGGDGTAERKGLDIATEADRRSSGFADFSANLQMVLRNRHGQESIRQMRIETLEVVKDGHKSLCIFDDPKDIKGTALLTHAHKKGDDDQWLYLPALKRVKRISSRNKSGSFVGSEFSYEDIASQELEKYTYRWVRDEELDEQACFVIERFPLEARYSGYSKQIVWLDKDHYRIHKVEYYDRKGSLLKTLVVGDYRLYRERFWRAHRMNMVNHQTGKSTRLVWSEYVFGKGLKDTEFTTNALLRAR